MGDSGFQEVVEFSLKLVIHAPICVWRLWQQVTKSSYRRRMARQSGSPRQHPNGLTHVSRTRRAQIGWRRPTTGPRRWLSISVKSVCDEIEERHLAVNTVTTLPDVGERRHLTINTVTTLPDVGGQQVAATIPLGEVSHEKGLEKGSHQRETSQNKTGD